MQLFYVYLNYFRCSSLLNCVSQAEIAKKIRKTFILAFKVIEFGGNREPVYFFLLVINSNLGHISHHYWDTATYWLKITNFSHPCVISCPHSGWPPSNLWKSFTVPETRVFQEIDGEDLVILACTVFDWSICVTDRQMDRIVMAKSHWKQQLLSRIKMVWN